MDLSINIITIIPSLWSFNPRTAELGLPIGSSHLHTVISVLDGGRKSFCLGAEVARTGTFLPQTAPPHRPYGPSSSSSSELSAAQSPGLPLHPRSHTRLSLLPLSLEPDPASQLGPLAVHLSQSRSA